LKDIFQGQLQLAVVDTSPRYLTEGSGALSGFGGPELRIVEGIEGFRAEIEMVPFERQWEAPVDGESEWIRLPALPVLLDCEARCVVADSLCEGSGIEPLAGGSVGNSNLLIGDELRAARIAGSPQFKPTDLNRF
jgi:hypothetical protein